MQLLIINTTEDVMLFSSWSSYSPLNEKRRGKRIYKILPISNLTIVMTTFNVEKDSLDFTSFPWMSSLSSYSTLPFTIYLSSSAAASSVNSQQIILSSYEDYDLTAKNLIFSASTASLPSASSSSSSSSSSFSASFFSSDGGIKNMMINLNFWIIFLIFACLAILSFGICNSRLFLRNSGLVHKKSKSQAFNSSNLPLLPAVEHSSRHSINSVHFIHSQKPHDHQEEMEEELEEGISCMVDLKKSSLSSSFMLSSETHFSLNDSDIDDFEESTDSENEDAGTIQFSNDSYDFSF
jgi:hypothetical protein